MYQSVLARFDLIVHGSEAQRHFWFKPHSQAWKNSTVVYNGVDSEHFEFIESFEAGKRLRTTLGVKPESLLMGTVGMCRPEKNQEVLLTTLRRLRVARVDAHLVIAGDGPLLQRSSSAPRSSRSLTACTSSARSKTCGPCSRRSTCSCCRRSPVESFSNAALEAMSMGRPVILSDIGGAREMITDGVEGYVVSPPSWRRACRP